jgi:hypothetical protein
VIFIHCFSIFFLGEFTFPIAIGLNVEFSLAYNNHGDHKFTRIPNAIVDKIALYGVGVTSALDPVVFNRDSPPKTEYFLTEDRSISNLNYEDITKTLISIELAGGLCNRTIGDAIIYLKRDQCPNYNRPVLIQSFRTPMVVPAQQLVVRFGSLQSDNINFALEVKRYLHAIHNDTAVLDLRNSSDPTVLSGAARFEYHPEPTLRVEVTGAKVPLCADPKLVAPYVATSLTVSNVTVYVTEEFPGVAACDNIEGTLNVTNYWGEEDVNRPALTVCRSAACNLSITADELFSPLTNMTYRVKSRAVVTLQFGYPILFPPFEKSVFIRMPARGHSDATEVSFCVCLCFIFVLFFFSSVSIA